MSGPHYPCPPSGPLTRRLAPFLRATALLLPAAAIHGQEIPAQGRSGPTDAAPRPGSLAPALPDAGRRPPPGRAGTAEPIWRQARAADEATYGPGHPAVAIRLSTLAFLLANAGRR